MMKSEIVSPRKRKKTQEESDDDEVDFLSKLPDNIIVSILSRLTIAEAARTSVLSVQWRNLWTYYFGSLYFDGSLVLPDRMNKIGKYLNDSIYETRKRFKRKVDQVLNSLQTQTLEALGICFDLGDDSHVNNWVEFAIQKKVKKLDLKLIHYVLINSTDYKFCAVPPSLLKLSSLPSLQVLRLSYVNVSGEDLEYLLSFCPFLQTLSVIYSKRVASLRVCSHTKLKELEIRNCRNLKTIEIFSENLMSFTYYGRYASINYGHILNLTEVCFGGADAERTLTDFLHLTIYDHSSYLKVLKLDISWNESWLKYELPKNMILANVQHLELKAGMEQNIYYLCVYVMNRCPSLSSLTLKIVSDWDQPPRFGIKHAYDCLKEIKIFGFSGNISEVRFIQYIIENATNLKKLLVDPIQPLSSFSVLEYHIVKSTHDPMERIRIRRLLAPFMPSHVEFIIL